MCSLPRQQEVLKHFIPKLNFCSCDVTNRNSLRYRTTDECHMLKIRASSTNECQTLVLRAGSLCSPTIELTAWIESNFPAEWASLGTIRRGELLIFLETQVPTQRNESFNLALVLSSFGIHYINMSYLQIDAE